MQEQLPVFPIIAISGSPRVGSMWSFNVARSLAREAGLKLVPERALKSDPEGFAVGESYLKSRPLNTRCIIKTHTKINASPSVRVIRNKRELRDRLFSLYRFTKSGFDEESLIDTIAWGLEVDAHYDQWPAESILNISFELIETSSIDVIDRIAEFIGLPAVDAQIITNIAARYSKQQVRKQIAELEDRVFDQEGNIKADVPADAVLEEGAGRLRAFDVESGFQSGHVSDYQPGDWKNLWTERQKQIVDNAIRKAQRATH